MSTAELFEHYMQAARDGRSVRIGDGERIEEAEVDHVRADTDGRRDFLKVTLKMPISHESEHRE